MRNMSDEEIISNYLEICLYNKDKETENKIKKGKANKAEKKKYKNIFRTEVKIKNLKLNANKNSGKILNKALETYYNDETTKYLYSNPIKKIFGENKFYRIDIALDIIERNEKMRKSTKNKLQELLKLINLCGFTSARKYWVEKYSEVTFRNHIKKIEALGINVLTFDKEIDGIEIKAEKMENFTNLKNSYKPN